MALTRETLRGMDLPEEKIAAIIAGHTDTVEALKKERDEWKDKAKSVDAVAKERDAAIKQRDALQKQIDEASSGTDWKAEYDKLKADTEAKETATKVKAAYRQLLKDAKVDEDMIDSIIDVTKFDGMKLDRDGALHDADRLTEGIASRYAKFIVTEGVKPSKTVTPPEGKPKAMTREEIWAKDDKGRYKLSTEERQKALTEHPELMRPGT